MSATKQRPAWAASAVMVASGISLYIGAALAVGLFEVFSPVIVAWMRIAGASVFLLALWRPKPSQFTWKTFLQALVYGLVTLTMNATFYLAIAHMEMGTAVAVEFLGPVVVAALGSRSFRDWLSLTLAIIGVVIISGATWSENSTGIMWALAAGGAWACYIVVGSRIAGQAGTSGQSMAVGFAAAALFTTPLVAWQWPEATPYDPGILVLLILGLGLLSAAIPYSLDQVVMRMAGTSGFALLQAILPVVAAVVGAIALGQWLSLAEVLGVLAVVIAVALRRP